MLTLSALALPTSLKGQDGIMNNLAINQSEVLARADTTNVVELKSAGDNSSLAAAFRHHAAKLRKTRELAKAKLEGNELSVDQAMLLLLIEESCSFSDVSQVAYFGTNASYLISQLARLGYVRLRIDTKDRRKRLITRTRKGREMTERIGYLLGEVC